MLDLSEMNFIELEPTESLKSYLGFVRNYYNFLITDKDKYKSMGYLDYRTKKNIQHNYYRNFDNLSLKKKKDGTKMIPLTGISINIKNNKATIVSKTKIKYTFDVNGIKDGYYSKCGIFQRDNNHKIELAINLKSKRHPDNKYISKNNFNKYKERKMNEALRIAVKSSKSPIEKRKDLILNIFDFMLNIDDVKCVQKSMVVKHYLDFKNQQDISNDENQIIQKYLVFIETIKSEFSFIKYYNHLLNFI